MILVELLNLTFEGNLDAAGTQMSNSLHENACRVLDLAFAEVHMPVHIGKLGLSCLLIMICQMSQSGRRFVKSWPQFDIL